MTVPPAQAGPAETGRRAAPVRRPRHLLDPDDLHGSHLRSIGTQQALTNVQRWVLSLQAVILLLHLSGGLVVAAMFLSEPDLAAQIGLNVLAGVIGAIAVAAGLAIHGRRILSWWLLLGVLPTLVGLWLTLR
jgi:hypothetical protein